MFVFSSTGHTLELLTGSAVSTDYLVSYEDNAGGNKQLGSSIGNVATATTTTILTAPGTSYQRRVLSVALRNRSATASQTVTLKFDVDATEYHVTPTILLLPGEALLIGPDGGYSHLDVNGVNRGAAPVTPLTIARHVHYEAPITADKIAIVAAAAMANGAAAIAAQPDFPRKLQVDIIDANSSVTAGNVVLVGTGASGQALTQTIALSGGSRTVTTDDAFAKLTSATTSGLVGATGADTLSIGPATALGLPASKDPVPGTFSVTKSNVTNADEAVGTVDTVAGTIIPTSVPNGTRTYDFWYTYKVTTQSTMTLAAHVHYEAPIAADLVTIVAALDPIANANLTIAAQPDFPRKLQVRIVDANSSVTAGQVVLTGTGSHGQTATQTISLSGGTRTVTTDDVYAKLSTAVVSGVVGAAAGDTIGIGPATALGLPASKAPVPDTFAVHKAGLNNADEAVGTVDTVAGSIIPTTAADGARRFDFWYTYRVAVN